MVVPVVTSATIQLAEFDIVVFINDGVADLGDKYAIIESALKTFLQVNPKTADEVTVLPFPKHPSNRLVYSPTGSLQTDTADIRNIYDAAIAGIRRVVSMGFKTPLLCVGPLKSASGDFPWMKRCYLLLNAVLGSLHAAYTPLEVAEMVPDKKVKLDKLAVFDTDANILKVAVAIEEGRIVARDIGGSDPERMAAPRIVEYLEKALLNTQGVKMTVEKVEKAKYPLMAAVNRAASTIGVQLHLCSPPAFPPPFPPAVPRHDGRVVHLDYTPAGDHGSGSSSKVDTTLFLVGKGITYDTGGADVKANGVMAGMHRDKCGAAAIAGFFKTLSLLQPSGLAVSASLAFVRNSIGEESYVADEVIVSRAGQRIRVGNTDAEGRMVMADLLCEAKERAVNATNPFLFTFATLTGHVVRAYGDYAAVMDNGPARVKRVSHDLQAAGDLISDLAEVSTVRREDFAFHKGPSEYEDVLQCNNLPSSATPRGHQTPAAFLALASGLHKHGLDSEKKEQLPYTHVDVAGAAAPIYVTPTASPLMMFTSKYVLPRVNFP